MKVGILGRPFEGMGDFDVDLKRLKNDWGPDVVNLDINKFAKNLKHVKLDNIYKKKEADNECFNIVPELQEDIHNLSLLYESALKMFLKGEKIHAFTMNFLNLIDSSVFNTLPFLGINKLMMEGMGYAGEGDVMTAAHTAQLRQLCGMSNFTEIYTIDYAKNRMLMTHMQECNPAMARKDRKISLVRKDFWAPGIKPYAGMHFTLEPGPVTISSVSFDSSGRFFYVVYETEIFDMEPLEKFDIPHWLIQLDEPAGDFLTRYCEAGGGHHLASVPGHKSNAIKKLAHLQGFDYKNINR